MTKTLTISDPEIAGFISDELARQRNGLTLIASENYVSPAVLEAVGSVLTNKYSEGYPGRRYYSGNVIIDQIETLAMERAQRLFAAEHANVQPHSGSGANMAVYFALLKPGDVILSMELAHGGHLTHGSPVSFSGQLYTVHHYGVDKGTERLDYDAIRATAKDVRPNIIVAGASAYPRTIDFAAFCSIADEVGAFLLADIAHIAGLVVTNLHPSPFPYADAVTATTHKTLRGPRGALILCRERYAKQIDKMVMPGIQGGPLDHVIAGKAVAFREAMAPAFADYQRRTITNASVLAETLRDEGLRLVSGGTENHLLLVDITPLGIGGNEAEKALERADISVNKNMIPFDARKPLDPSGIRLGTPAVTTRGLTENDMRTLGKTIATVLRAPHDATILEGAQKTVAALAAAYPLYPELS